jgi:protocatechuate 3,4-dioxygenase beta subunit
MQRSLIRYGPLDWHRINRRGFLYALGAVPILKGQQSSPSCALSPEQEEGPYYIDGAALRPNVTEDKPGVPLRLRIALIHATHCSPLANAAIDIWHCDAGGVYSGFTAASMNQREGPPRPPQGPDSPPPFGPPRGESVAGGRGPRTVDATRFLRGVQISNEHGMVEFRTIYPGWYAGRTIHVHVKVHLGGEPGAATYSGGHVSHTGQLFFPEDASERIAKLAPYNRHAEVHRTTHDEDGIFLSQHGNSSLVRLEGKPDATGFVATAALAVDPEQTPPRIGPGGRGPGGSPPRPRR